MWMQTPEIRPFMQNTIRTLLCMNKKMLVVHRQFLFSIKSIFFWGGKEAY